MTKGQDPKADIDEHLRRAFEEIQNDPLPDKLMGLLDKLRKQDAEDEDKAPASSDADNS
ncbi:NepR family anti-sigma factor [Histidinibacterium aquaticum]|uniref:NepR family anti-sigma factor n=1 Tax=Histidinibacterium aquaticum TaxID=2613962 RepID=UPI00168A962D|nr:NepR family anti-sigma factor [Histidinibacterium aquaticum]